MRRFAGGPGHSGQGVQDVRAVHCSRADASPQHLDAQLLPNTPTSHPLHSSWHLCAPATGGGGALPGAGDADPARGAEPAARVGTARGAAVHRWALYPWAALWAGRGFGAQRWRLVLAGRVIAGAAAAACALVFRRRRRCCRRLEQPLAECAISVPPPPPTPPVSAPSHLQAEPPLLLLLLLPATHRHGCPMRLQAAPTCSGSGRH